MKRIERRGRPSRGWRDWDTTNLRLEHFAEVGMHDVISETTNAEAKQFDFLEGEWNAICRFPQLDGSWGEGPGSLKASKVLDGGVSLEFFEGPYQGTMIKGLGLRAFNPQTSQWEHTWRDTSAPGGFLVWRGRFEGNAIELHGQWKDETGHHVLSRLTWSRITERSAHWEVTGLWMAAKPGLNTGSLISRGRTRVNWQIAPTKQDRQTN